MSPRRAPRAPRDPNVTPPPRRNRGWLEQERAQPIVVRGKHFNPARASRFLDALRSGMSFSRSARYAGLNPAAIKSWLRIARQEETAPAEIVEFHNEVLAASAYLERALLSIIIDAAHSGTWQSAAWLLERLWPDRYARVIRREISGVERRPLRVVLDVGRADGPLALVDEDDVRRPALPASADDLEQALAAVLDDDGSVDDESVDDESVDDDAKRSDGDGDDEAFLGDDESVDDGSDDDGSSDDGGGEMEGDEGIADEDGSEGWLHALR